jgi:anti-sigma regulatory factor (Ser/Thr protein kinase)
MDTMARPCPIVQRSRRVSLANRPAAAAEARRQVLATIYAWDIPVDLDVAVLLTSELVTNAIRHEAGETITLTITRVCGQLRVDVHDTSRTMPVIVDAPADAEAGRGMMLVASLSTDWGVHRTRSGKAVYFTLAFDMTGRAPRSFRRDGAQGGLASDVYARMDVELLQNVGDVGSHRPPGQ